MDMLKGRICVTGGSGFLASWIIKRLLEEGLVKDVSYLTNLPHASERLKIFDADLSKPETFEEPIKGCIGVFHVAHPMDFEGNNTEELIVEESIKGSLGKKHTEVVDEESWSDVDYIRTHIKFGAWCHISKTSTEKAIIVFSEKEGLDVVTILPTFIHGPFLGPRCPHSVRDMMAMIFGELSLVSLLVTLTCIRCYLERLSSKCSSSGKSSCLPNGRSRVQSSLGAFNGYPGDGTNMGFIPGSDVMEGEGLRIQSGSRASGGHTDPHRRLE
ncbi:hypothetical protein R6Q59_016759 [Mikania micrantha]